MSGLRGVIKILSDQIDFGKLFGTPKSARESLKAAGPVRNDSDTSLTKLYKDLYKQQEMEKSKLGFSEDLDDYMEYLNPDEIDTLVKLLKNPNLDDTARNKIIDNLLNTKRNEMIGKYYDNVPNIPRGVEVGRPSGKVPTPANDPTFTIVK